MSKITLNQQLGRIEISSFEVENKIVFNFFDNIPVNEREDKLYKALYIGVLALMEDRIATFLSKTTNELGTELESLKMIFEMKRDLFYKSSIKGNFAEEEIAETLNQYFIEKKIKDKATLTGSSIGQLPRNKTGDIICEVEGDSNKKIAIECKFDKNIKLGEIESKDIFTRKSDTAWSQLLEAQANRDAKVGIIIFDISLIDNSIVKNYENVGYINGVGFIAIVDSQKGNYTNLFIAYMLARDILLNSRNIELDKEILGILINRIIKDFTEILSIKSLVHSNIENNKTILKQLEKSMLLIEFNQDYLMKFLKEGTLTKADLLAFYSGEDIRDKYRLIEKEITETINK